MTIYALSSGIGTSGIAVVRISGPDAKLVIEKLTSGPFPLPRMATLKKVNNINKTSMIDEGIVIWYPGPNSYTGEDMSEIQVHGSRAVVNSLLKSISHIKNCRSFSGVVIYSTFRLSGSLTKSGNFFSISAETPI